MPTWFNEQLPCPHNVGPSCPELILADDVIVVGVQILQHLENPEAERRDAQDEKEHGWLP